MTRHQELLLLLADVETAVLRLALSQMYRRNLYRFSLEVSGVHV